MAYLANETLTIRRQKKGGQARADEGDGVYGLEDTRQKTPLSTDLTGDYLKAPHEESIDR